MHLTPWKNGTISRARGRNGAPRWRLAAAEAGWVGATQQCTVGMPRGPAQSAVTGSTVFDI